MKRLRLSRDFALVNVIRLAVLAGFLLLWETTFNRKWINPLFIGRPSKMWEFLYDNLRVGRFWRLEILTTLREAVYGFALGSAAGVVLALLLSQLPFVERVTSPFFTLFNAMPKVGFAPLLTLWFGLGEMSKIVLVASIVFFIVFVPTLAALKLVDPDLVMVSRTMGATRLQLFQKTSVPAIVPPLFGAFRLGAVYSLLAASFGEMLASKHGLGGVLVTRTNNFDISGAFGVMLILALMALALNGLLGLVERRLLRWQESNTTVSEG
jgi:NitT/TauT family transport system permease protein